MFNAECYTISEAVRITAVRSDYKEVTKITIFSNSTTVMKKVQHTKPGRGQRVTIKMVEHNNKLFTKGTEVVYRWVPSHEGVEGNEKADEEVKAAALGEEKGIKAIAERYRGMSLARIQREVTEAKWTETEAW